MFPRWRGHLARAISNKNQQQPLYKRIEAVLQNTYFSRTKKNLDYFKDAVA